MMMTETGLHRVPSLQLRRIRTLSCIGRFALLLTFAATTPSIAAGSADLILRNARIHTPTGPVQSMALQNGFITAAGSNEAIEGLRVPETRVLDLGGRAVLPGLYDMHVHTLFGGQDLKSCKFAPGAAPQQIVDAVKRCVAASKPGEWIIGGSWVDAVFKPGEQHARLLDSAAPDNPVLLKDESLHSAWINTRALELAGITADTPDPEDGIIERDAAGEPTGVLRETAAMAVSRRFTKASVDDQVAAIRLATDAMLAYGIVGFTDALVSEDSIAGLSRYAASGELKQHARGCIAWGPFNEGGAPLIEQRNQYAAGRLQLDCVKIILDGVPLLARTAALLDPYEITADAPHAAAHRGMLMVPQHELNAAVARFDAEGLQVKFHAAGDGAVRAAIEAIAFARKTNGYTGRPHDIGHNSMVHPDDITRFRELGFSFEFSPYIWYPTPITSNDIAAAIGPERLARVWPIREAIAAGALVVTGSDWPVVPSANPWLALETLVTRKLPGNTGDPIAAAQAITLDAAFKVFTANGAALLGRLDQGGTLEVGKAADFIVLERSPFDMPVGEIHDIKVQETWISGERVYARSDAAAD